MATQVVEEIAMSNLHNNDNNVKSKTDPEAKSNLIKTSSSQNDLSNDSPAVVDQYVHGTRLTLLTISLMLGVFTIALDTTIICSFSNPLTS
jgi:hypothetical protein